MFLKDLKDSEYIGKFAVFMGWSQREKKEERNKKLKEEMGEEEERGKETGEKRGEKWNRTLR